MRDGRRFFGLVTTAVAGSILLPLVADWYAPGIELHLAEEWLGLGDDVAE